MMTACEYACVYVKTFNTVQYKNGGPTNEDAGIFPLYSQNFWKCYGFFFAVDVNIYRHWHIPSSEILVLQTNVFLQMTVYDGRESTVKNS